MRSIADTHRDCNSNSRSKRYAYRDGNSDTYTNRDSNTNPNPYTESYANAATCADAKGPTNAAAATVVGNITN